MMGIRGQLTIVPAIVAVALIFAASVAVRYERADEFDDFRVRNTKVLEALSVPIGLYVAQVDADNLYELVTNVSETLKNSDMLDLVVLDNNRRVIAHQSKQNIDSVMNDAFSHAGVEADGEMWARDHDVLMISVPVASGEHRLATVQARLSLQRLNGHINSSANQWMLGAAVLFLFISIALAVGLNRFVVAPIRALQAAVTRMGEGSLSIRAPALRGRELNELSQSVNRMAQALSNQRETLEQSVLERTRELQEANARLEKIAVTDGLTGLLNHRRFHEILQAEMLRSERHRRPMGVLMIDVDYFKRVNDSRGHPVGDEVLRQLGVVLKEALRQTDVIARYGGEEFSAVLPETTKAEALQAGERARIAVEEKLNDAKAFGQGITVSIGVATYPEDGSTAEAVLNAADQSLYLAKRQGRNRVVGNRAA